MVQSFVVGYPLSLDGTAGQQARHVEGFARRLGKSMGVPVELWDERLTTAEAERMLIAADASRKRRADVIDKLAATLILQGALEYEGLGTLPLIPPRFGADEVSKTAQPVPGGLTGVSPLIGGEVTATAEQAGPLADPELIATQAQVQEGLLLLASQMLQPLPGHPSGVPFDDSMPPAEFVTAPAPTPPADEDDDESEENAA